MKTEFVERRMESRETVRRIETVGAAARRKEEKKKKTSEVSEITKARWKVDGEVLLNQETRCRCDESRVICLYETL